MRHFVALELGRGRWDLRSLVCKEIGNDMLQELTANIYQGFNLQQEQEASGVGQCVCSRTAAAELRNRTQTHSKAAPSPIISPGSRDVLSQEKEGVISLPKHSNFPVVMLQLLPLPPLPSRSPQFLLLTPSHHEILQWEAEEVVSYSSYLSTVPQISEV